MFEKDAYKPSVTWQDGLHSRSIALAHLDQNVQNQGLFSLITDETETELSLR